MGLADIKGRISGIWNGAPAFFSGFGSFVLFAVRRFYADGMGLAAGALTYSTLLALVPLMVLTFAILSGFPAFDSARERMQEMFFDTVVPEVGVEVQSYLSDFSQNASNLTAVGVVALAVTAVLLLSTIEATLNRIWRVERPRPMGIRLLIFWTILTLGPLLIGASFALTSDTLSTALSWAQEGVTVVPLDVSRSVLNTLVAIVAQSVALTLIFLLVPARPVRLRDAAIGGTISGIGVQILRWWFNAFLTSGTTYETIYGAVAVIPIFLVWIYASWTVVIFGAVFAAAFPDWWKMREPQPGGVLSPARRLEVAVALLALLARRARQGGPVTQADLQDQVPLDGRDDLIEALHKGGYIVTTEDDCICLARDLYVTTVDDLAHDLGLSLGLDPPDDPDSASGKVFPRIEKETGQLPQLLQSLRDAEAEILGRPIAEIVAPPPSGEPVLPRIARSGTHAE